MDLIKTKASYSSEDTAKKGKKDKPQTRRKYL